MTTSQVTVYLPLIVQILYGMSPLTAGYVAALLSVAWTTMALGSAGFQDLRVRLAILLGPPVMTCGVFALYTSIAHGDLMFLGGSIALTGAGIGLCFAHISSWTITAARPGEESITASAIPTMQALGIAFGAALAGFVANAAGLTKGVSPTTMALAAHRIYLVSVLAPAAITLLSWRLVQHYKKSLVTTIEPLSGP
jgi:hypothetical protein